MKDNVTDFVENWKSFEANSENRAKYEHLIQAMKDGYGIHYRVSLDNIPRWILLWSTNLAAPVDQYRIDPQALEPEIKETPVTTKTKILLSSSSFRNGSPVDYNHLVQAILQGRRVQLKHAYAKEFLDSRTLDFSLPVDQYRIHPEDLLSGVGTKEVWIDPQTDKIYDQEGIVENTIRVKLDFSWTEIT